jgi:hypothetical protein
MVGENGVSSFAPKWSIPGFAPAAKGIKVKIAIKIPLPLQAQLKGENWQNFGQFIRFINIDSSQIKSGEYERNAWKQQRIESILS